MELRDESDTQQTEGSQEVPQQPEQFVGVQVQPIEKRKGPSIEDLFRGIALTAVVVGTFALTWTGKDKSNTWATLVPLAVGGSLALTQAKPPRI